MADLPIPFSAPMVRALLREVRNPGTGKTQTRRLINPQPFGDGYYDGEIDCTHVPAQASNLSAFFRFGATAVGGGAVRTETWEPRYVAGDRLYVREAIERWESSGVAYVRFLADDRATFHHWPEAWRRRFAPPMHMPKKFSRLTLIVTEVRVERLQAITWQDAKAEGIEGGYHQSEFAMLWDSINADRAPWASNPWVAAYSFTVHPGNIDSVGAAA
jgi:hypothetical protein